MKTSKLVSILIGAVLVGGIHGKADDGLSSLLQQSTPSPAASGASVPAIQASSVSTDTSPADPLDKINAAIAQNPHDPIAYIRRGNLYGKQKMWDQARGDYQKAVSLDPQLVAAQIDLAEIELRQKQYDQARSGFVALTQDKNFGDLAAYKVFLCDLLASHEAAANQELVVFNDAGENPSYYFGNIAWDIVHNKADDARSYLKSATSIYKPSVASLYTSNLVELGYLPLKE